MMMITPEQKLENSVKYVPIPIQLYNKDYMMMMMMMMMMISLCAGF